MPYKILDTNPKLDPAKKAARELRYRQQRESNRMSIHIMRLLNEHSGGVLSSVMYGKLWPDKIDMLMVNPMSAMRAVNFTMGRARNSFMGLLATGERRGSKKGMGSSGKSGEVLWRITETGEYYLKVYNTTPQVIIDGERDSRSWLQDNGRRYMNTESIEKRVQEEVQVKKELRRMRESTRSVTVEYDRKMLDIYSTYESLIHPRFDYCYQVGRNNRRKPIAR